MDELFNVTNQIKELSSISPATGAIKEMSSILSATNKISNLSSISSVSDEILKLSSVKLFTPSAVASIATEIQTVYQRQNSRYRHLKTFHRSSKIHQ